MDLKFTPDDYKNELDQTLLVYMARLDKTRSVEHLFNKYGVDLNINEQDLNGFTALHYAVINKNAEMVKFITNSFWRDKLQYKLKNKIGLSAEQYIE